MENPSGTLKIIEQKTILFYEDELIAVRSQDGSVYVSIKHLCDALELNVVGQIQRINRTTVLEKGYRKGQVQFRRGRRESSLLQANLIPLWLAGISTKSIKSEAIRERLEKYQTEAAQVLWEAFQEGRLTNDVSIDDLLATDSPAAQAYQMAAAIMKMARQQLMLESQIETQAAQLAQHEERLEQIETTLGDPDRQITPEQAMQISQGVKTVARELGKRTKRNEYGGVYGELYRRYGINSYKTLPVSKFDDALNWLNDWLQSIIDDTPF